MSLRGKSVADPQDQVWIDLVAEHGHALVKVAHAVDQPPFAYSLGAYESYGAPELIVFGLEGDVAATILNDVMNEYAAGRRFRSGVEEQNLIGGGVPLIFLEASPGRGSAYATHADWYYERQPFPLWQLFWPAKNGCFPWDAGYPSDMANLQPDLTSGGFAGHPAGASDDARGER